MRKIVDKMMDDLSTKEAFLYRITCAVCLTQYSSKPRRFSKSGVAPTTESKRIIYDALYEQEHHAARQIGAGEIAEHMNYCPICKQLICNQCFLICNDLDMCKRCAAELEEEGKPVVMNIADAAV